MAMKKTIQMNSETTDILLKDAFEEYILEKTARNLAQPTLTSYRESCLARHSYLTRQKQIMIRGHPSSYKPRLRRKISTNKIKKI